MPESGTLDPGDGAGRARRARHPGDGTLRTWLDGAMGPVRRWRVGRHVAGCARCAARAAELRDLDARAAGLVLRLGAPGPVDTADAWARQRVRRGGDRRRVPRAALAGAGAVAAAALAVGAWWAARRSGPDARPPAVRAGGPAGEGLLEWVARWERAGARVARDLCCADLDGGGRADDGLLTLSGPGEEVAWVVLYEDREGAGTLTARSLVRYLGPAR
jgi:hypothetical protein